MSMEVLFLTSVYGGGLIAAYLLGYWRGQRKMVLAYDWWKKVGDTVDKIERM